MARPTPIAALSLLLLAAPVAAAPPAPRGPYDLKSGHLVQKGDFMGESTTEVWWDDYGAREARRTVSTGEVAFGRKLQVETLDIRTPERTINIDLKKMKGRVSAGMVPARQDDVSGMSAKQRADYKVEELPDRVVAGKTCKGISMEMNGFPIRAWTWKGIPMLTQTRVGGGMTSLETVSIEENVQVPPDRFKPPEGVTLKP